MSSKRKVQSLGLERRVRPRREEKWQPEAESEDEQSADDGPVAQPIEKADSDSDDDDDEKSEPGSSDGSDSEVCSQPYILFNASSRRTNAAQVRRGRRAAQSRSIFSLFWRSGSRTSIP